MNKFVKMLAMGMIGGGGTQEYWQKVKALFGSSIVAYWPLWETGGTTVTDVKNGLTGSLGTGGATPTLGATGIGDGKTAISFDGGDFINIYSTALNAAFNGAELTLLLWAKVTDATIWSDGANHYMMKLDADANNNIYIFKATNGKLYTGCYLGGANSANNIIPTNEGWFRLGLIISKSGNLIRMYINGTNQHVDDSNIGTWVGALAANINTIGSANTTPSSPWKGSLAHVVLLNKAATDAEMMQDFRYLPGIEILTVIGDSISSKSTDWPYVIQQNHAAPWGMYNHAVASTGIIDNLATQVTASSGDNADRIILELGSNDDNNGNMSTLQATAEAGIIALKASNPRAAIYYLNVLPKWTDVGGGTEVDKSHIRTAIAAACTAQNVTCWDTYTTPWIAAADTSDGIHPTAAGSVKVAAEVLARL